MTKIEKKECRSKKGSDAFLIDDIVGNSLKGFLEDKFVKFIRFGPEFQKAKFKKLKPSFGQE
jgi:hypothetical protein